jgi:6-phosphogluconolactonase/glucosamine-6-phosphate isomerase/deaminase
MSIKFTKITSTEPVIEYLVQAISEQLKAGKRVFWLVPGGSSISIAAEVSKRLSDTPLDKLTVTLTDERYGDVGHADSNWKQLADAGFALPGADLHPVLDGQDMLATVSHFAETLQTALENADYALGFFGIGPDGHTAGILPGSPAVTETAFAAGYDAGNFKRITMTPPAIAKLDEAVVYAVGEAKWPIFEQLGTDLPLEQQPAQSLKQVPKTTIFNDHIDS